MQIFFRNCTLLLTRAHEKNLRICFSSIPYLSAYKPWAYLSSKGFSDGPIRGGRGLSADHKKRQVKILENMEKMYRIIRLFTH